MSYAYCRDISNRFHSRVLIVTDIVPHFTGTNHHLRISMCWGNTLMNVSSGGANSNPQCPCKKRSRDIPDHWWGDLAKWASSSCRGPTCIKAIRKRPGKAKNTVFLWPPYIHTYVLTSTQTCVHHTHIHCRTSGRHDIRNGRQNRQIEKLTKIQIRKSEYSRHVVEY